MTRWQRLSLLLGLALLAACTESHVRGPSNDGKPRGSTETGNPPVIDISAIALVVRSSAVHIVGEPGAVTPGGIEVEIDNLRSGEDQRGAVAQDGSFDVQVSGTMDDAYALRALGATPAAVSTPVYVHRGGARVEQGLSCEERADVIEAELTRVAANVDIACTSHADCTQLLTPVSCPSWVCGGPIATRAASIALAPAIEAVTTAWCEPFERDDCFDGMILPVCTKPGPFACIDQKCQDCTGGGCESAVCDGACATPRIEWTVHMGPTRSTYALRDCKTLTAPSGCTSEPPCIAPRDIDDSSLSIAYLQNMLAAPEVQAALADETSFGFLTPGGFFTEVNVGGRSFLVTTTTCESPASCTDAPQPVSELVQSLRSFAEQYTCE